MPELAHSLPDGYGPQSMIDLKSDKRTRNVILFLRLLSVVFFVPLFAGVPLTFRYKAGFDPIQLWGLGLDHLPWFVTFLGMGAAAFVIAAIHEGLHAGILVLFGAPGTTIGVDGIAPRAHNAGAYLSRRSGVLVAVGPFLIISTIAVVALLVVPDNLVAWVFLPAVVHGVISASDFVVVAWLAGTPRGAFVSVLSDGWVAYGPGPIQTKKRKKKKK